MRTVAEPDVNETIAAYTADGMSYEIDHLGIGHPHQWGQFAVYRDGQQVSAFEIPESALRPEHRPKDLPVTPAELIELAQAAVAEVANHG